MFELFCSRIERKSERTNAKGTSKMSPKTTKNKNSVLYNEAGYKLNKNDGLQHYIVTDISHSNLISMFQDFFWMRHCFYLFNILFNLYQTLKTKSLPLIYRLDYEQCC